MAAARQKKQEDNNAAETQLVNQLAKGIGIGLGAAATAAAAAGMLQVLGLGQQGQNQQQPKPKKKKKAPPPPPTTKSPPSQPPAPPQKKSPNKPVAAQPPKKSSSTSSIASSSASASSSTGSLPLPSKKSNVAAAVVTPLEASELTIVIAVHASNKQAGGLLFLPRTKTIHFYSIKWSEHLKIPDDRDNIQLLNVCLALEIFANFLRDYRRGGGDRLKVKTGFKGCLSPSTGTDFLKKLTAKIEAEPFRGEWRYYAQSTDPHQKIAERLGNKEWKADSSTLPNTKPAHSYLAPEFRTFNISKSDLAALHSLALEASEEFQ